MAQDEKSRRDYLSIEAVNPSDGKSCSVLISHGRMQAVGKQGMARAKECAFIVPAILKHPTAIFEGLRLDEDESRHGYGWRCYCGIPSQAYDIEGEEIRPKVNQVYVVFVNEERVAYNWRWEDADPDDPKLPLDHDRRFKKRLL